LDYGTTSDLRTIEFIEANSVFYFKRAHMSLCNGIDSITDNQNFNNIYKILLLY
ncbi:864_t:CDS:1, partial [Ambispora gerdemannii]